MLVVTVILQFYAMLWNAVFLTCYEISMQAIRFVSYALRNLNGRFNDMVCYGMLVCAIRLEQTPPYKEK